MDRAQTAAEESESSANGNDVEHSSDEASDDESGSEENSANGEHVAEDEENEGTNWPAFDTCHHYIVTYSNHRP